jgi:hypothetical protein
VPWIPWPSKKPIQRALRGLSVLSARRLLGVPMGELVNRLVRMEDLLGCQADELTERLAEAASVGA